MEIAISAPVAVQKRLVNGGWRLVDPRSLKIRGPINTFYEAQRGVLWQSMLM